MKHWARLYLALPLAMCFAAPLNAQTWLGLTLGAPMPDTVKSAYPTPLFTDETRKDAPDGTETFCHHVLDTYKPLHFFVVTDGCDGPVMRIYLANYFAHGQQAPAHIQSLSLGISTFADVRRLFGHEGVELDRKALRMRRETIYTHRVLYHLEGGDALLILDFNTDSSNGFEGSQDALDDIAKLSGISLALQQTVTYLPKDSPFHTSDNTRYLSNPFAD